MRPGTFSETVKVLEKLGYRHVRTEGSHHQFVKPGVPVVSVPFRSRGELASGTFRNILRAAGVSPREFWRLLKSR